MIMTIVAVGGAVTAVRSEGSATASKAVRLTLGLSWGIQIAGRIIHPPVPLKRGA